MWLALFKLSRSSYLYTMTLGLLFHHRSCISKSSTAGTYFLSGIMTSRSKNGAHLNWCIGVSWTHSLLLCSKWLAKLIFSICMSVFHDSIYMHEFPWRKWLLCSSSEKRNWVLCSCGPPKHHSSPSAAITAMSLSSRWTFWYITKATVAN